MLSCITAALSLTRAPLIEGIMIASPMRRPTHLSPRATKEVTLPRQAAVDDTRW